jgi:hypothetical protein
MFAPELETTRRLAQRLPEQDFGQAHITTSRPRSAYGVSSTFRQHILEHRDSPSTMLRMVPLPETSSGRN